MIRGTIVLKTATIERMFDTYEAFKAYIISLSRQGYEVENYSYRIIKRDVIN